MAFLTPPPDPNPRLPRYRAPAGAIDCHMHLFGPKDKYGFDHANAYVSDDALPETYLALQDHVGLGRAVITSGAAYGMDYRHLLDTLERFPHRFRGVALLAEDVSDAEMERMHGLGVRGVRFFSEGRWKNLPRISASIARRAAALGWPVHFYAKGTDLVDYHRPLLDLGANIVLDHFGSIPGELGIGQPAAQAMFAMLDTGRVWVKLSGPMRCCAEEYPYPSMSPIARAIATRFPDRILWGSDWPHTNMVGQTMPNDGDLMDLIPEWIDDETIRLRMLVDNPAALYGF